MWVWVLVIGGVLAFFFVAALAVIGLANRRWEQQQPGHEPGPHGSQQPPAPESPA